MTPKRVERTRKPGQPGIPNGAVYVGRGRGDHGRWGNPFVVGEDADDAAHATKLFEEWLAYDSSAALDPYGSSEYRQEMSDRREWILSHAHELRGKDLACWCKLPEPGQPDHCHARVLIELASQGEPST
ncbi:DUF4326 domain-containing protein [Streptomyces sp. NPDC005407]|uniref:DUF4326 domain-containing protein n=1 Tax=Streptomyces sp. NPDC005407 TaxID=3155340 RepID=UPI0033B6F29B